MTETPQITYLDEYYLTNHEIDILEAHAKDMAAQVPSGAMIMELGSGLVSHAQILSPPPPLSSRE